MKLVVMLRVKDGMLFAEIWYNYICNLADEIVVVDNGSTDGTFEYLSNCSKVSKIVKTEGFHEGRDRIIMLQLARERNADWLMTLDIDEIFEKNTKRRDLDRLMNHKRVKTWDFRLFHLINDEDHFCASWRDLKELSYPRRSLFKNHEKLFVRNVKIHCGVEGKLKPRRISKLRIKHYCNLFKEYRLNAYENYLQVDENKNKHKIYYRDIEILKRDDYPNMKFINSDKRLLFMLEFYLLNLLRVYVFAIKKIKSLKK